MIASSVLPSRQTGVRGQKNSVKINPKKQPCSKHFPAVCSQWAYCAADMVKGTWKCFHIRPHAALVLTPLFISWLLSLGRSSWKIQNTIFSRGHGGNNTAGSQRAPDQGQRSESQGSYHIDAGHGLTLSILSVGRSCQGGCVPSTISRCLDFM